MQIFLKKIRNKELNFEEMQRNLNDKELIILFQVFILALTEKNIYKELSEEEIKDSFDLLKLLNNTLFPQTEKQNG